MFRDNWTSLHGEIWNLRATEQNRVLLKFSLNNEKKSSRCCLQAPIQRLLLSAQCNETAAIYKLKLGDINLLNCHIDNKTSDHYLDMLLDLGYMPLITCTKATRVIDHTATLIDLI